MERLREDFWSVAEFAARAVVDATSEARGFEIVANELDW